MSRVINPTNPATSEPLPDGGFDIRGIEDQENRLEGSSNSDIITGGNLNDFLSGSSGSGADTIAGGRGDDTLDGGDGNDELSGDAGNDVILGGSGANIIRGGEGDDRLIIEADDTSTVTGGEGADIFQIQISSSSNDDSEVSQQQVQTANFEELAAVITEITDFTPGEDQIRIQGVPGTQAPVYNRDTGILSLDDLEIAQLSAGLNISEADLEIVGNDNPISNVSNEEATVYRFFNPAVGVHFYTSSEAERESIEQNLPNYELEGASYRTTDPTTGAQEVYRFFNSETGVHLYTTNEQERDSIIANLPNFAFEGVQFYAYETEVEGSIPVYRFYEPTLGVHFYTPNEAERDSVQANLTNYTYEGIAYYALPIDQADV